MRCACSVAASHRYVSDMTTAAALAALLARHSYREGDFTLSSGARSTFYLDAKQVTYHPDGVAVVGDAVLQAIAGLGVQAVGGLTMGADAIIVSTVWASVRAGAPLPGFVVRKEAKGHGTQQWIEGIHPKGMTVAIVDDVITSGASALKAVDRVEADGAKAVVIVGLVDRLQGGREAIEGRGLQYRAACTIDDVRAAFRNGAAGRP